MTTKKLISMLLATSMLAATAVNVLAAAPADYDGKAYESLGYSSEDPDGEINLAVIANGKVDLVGDSMYILGSVYSNDTIYVGNGSGNKVDGLFISGVKGMWDYADPRDEGTDDVYRKGYIHVDDDHNLTTNAYSVTLDYEGAILDLNTSFDYAYEPFTVPEVANNKGDANMNVYNPKETTISWWPEVVTGPNPDAAPTVTEDTAYGTVNMNGTAVDEYDAALTIDTTEGDVVVVIDSLPYPTNPSIKVVGDHEAYIYINNVSDFNNWRINFDCNSSTNWQVKEAGSVEHTHLFLTGDSISMGWDNIAVADMNVNANSLSINGSSKFFGNIYSNCENFTVTGGNTVVTGVVRVPNADSRVVDSSTLYGQIYTDTLTINGWGSIIYKADTAAEPTDATPAPETTPAPEATPAPTTAPVPTGTPLDLTGIRFAYIFGYEPDKLELVWVDDENGGHTQWNAEIRMAPNDSVTREQVTTMLMRLIDQKYDTKNVSFKATGNIADHAGTWYERSFAYVASTGAFDGQDDVYTGAVTRGEVAKLVSYALNLSETKETTFEDIADNPYKTYIEIMNAYGYMNGLNDKTFEPDRVMTRAEFCAMLNRIIGRENALLEAKDGRQVTPETYYFTDLHEGEWYTPVMLRATSAYDEDGYVDIDTRLSNIRNVLDNYDSQKMF